MAGVLVDSSIWIDYFRGGGKAAGLDYLIDENLLLTNDLILAELLPWLKLKQEACVIELLQKLQRLPLRIDWEEIVELQVRCLRAGMNGIGIPDLIIAQNARDAGCPVYSLDRHFRLLAGRLGMAIYE